MLFCFIREITLQKVNKNKTIKDAFFLINEFRHLTLKQLLILVHSFCGSSLAFTHFTSTCFFIYHLLNDAHCHNRPHVFGGETTQRRVITESLHAQRLAREELDQSGVTPPYLLRFTSTTLPVRPSIFCRNIFLKNDFYLALK